MDLELWMPAGIGGLLGLLIGSFLNVVIHRLPKMMERQWALESAQLTGTEPEATAALNLLTPRSRCPHCAHAIRWYENLPVVSYLLLRGKCSACAAPIGLRYPIVELITAALFAWSFQKWGLTPTALCWSLFCATLVALALIDWDTTLLPDDMTLPLLWGGLIAAAFQWISVPLVTAFWGAVAGYLSLWLVYWGFKLVTGKEGMGHGDFKLFAAMGAWFGWDALVPMILMASVIGAAVGIAMKFASSLREGGYVPFGPFLAASGLTAMLFGPQSILQAVGL